jgi:hypothetical protein
MKKVIGVGELQGLGLLGAEFTDLDLYDAFMMYLILNNESAREGIVLQYGDYKLNSKHLLRIDSWMI